MEEKKVGATEEKQEAEAVEEIVTAPPVIAEKPKQPDVPEPATEKYRLKSLMNIRKRPSLESTIIGKLVKEVREVRAKNVSICHSAQPAPSVPCQPQKRLVRQLFSGAFFGM